MDEIFINIKYQNEWIRKYFTKDFITINELIGVIEDLDSEVEYLKEQIQDMKEEHEPDAYDIWHDRQLEENNE